VDAGTTGFVNFADFRRNRIARSQVRVLAFVNIAAWGIPTSLAGELEDLRYARPKETISVLQENADVAVGVKGRMRQGHRLEALDQALEAARAANVPLMVHISPGTKTPELLKRLRPGDILTHCFQGRGDGILDCGELIPEALLAKKEGVIFDVGHGCGSFSWGTAKKAFEHFFYPDTISTDLHRYSVERWAFDMLTTMSKFLHLGMSIEDVILKSTWAPAKAIRRERELGTLRVGTPADLLVFSVESGEFPLEDTHLKVETANRRIKPYFVTKAGTIVGPECGKGSLRTLYECDYDIFDYVERTSSRRGTSIGDRFRTIVAVDASSLATQKPAAKSASRPGRPTVGKSQIADK